MPGPVVQYAEEEVLFSIKEEHRQKQEDDDPIIEDANEDDDDDEDDDDAEGDQVAGANESSKQSRSEKKSRKAMLKLGMKPVTGVSRVTIKRTKNAKIEDLSSQLQTQAAQQFRMPDLSGVTAKPDGSVAALIDEDEDEIDDSGVEPRDIDLVMTQAGVSKGKAVKALKTHNGDIVSAIMELTA